MSQNLYMINMQYALYLAHELHRQGYGNLKVIPSLSPSGTAWRCSFETTFEGRKYDCVISNWIDIQFDIMEKEIDLPINMIARKFIDNQHDFIEKCIGNNEIYVQWFRNMLSKLEKDELPYAFHDYEIFRGYWQTSKGNKISTLLDGEMEEEKLNRN